MIARTIRHSPAHAPRRAGRLVRAAQLLGFLLAALLLGACGQEPAPRSARSTAQPSQPSAAATPGLAQADPRGLGDPNAPITVIEYSDYQ